MTYKAGIIGTGGIAGMGILGMHDEADIGRKKIRASHAGGYDACAELELVAVSDIDEGKLTRFGDAWDIDSDHRYTDHNKMLATEPLDVVSVCTPSYLHHEHVIDAAQSAADPSLIWCEKPIATQLTAAYDMIETCEATGTELLINHSFRFTEKLQTLHHLIREEELLGDIRSVSSQFRMELLRNSTHLIDMLVYLLDVTPSHASGYINGENEATDSLNVSETVDDAGGGGFVVMDDGTFVTIDCTIPRGISSMNLTLIGTNGKLYMNNDDGEWRYWRLTDGEHIETELPGIEGSWTWDTDYEAAFTNAANHIVDVIAGREENRSPATEAVQSLEIIVGFYVSHSAGGHLTFPLDRVLEDVQVTSW